MSDRLTPDLLVRAYASGVFPMAERADSAEIFWVQPKRRGILPLEALHVSHSLARAVRRQPFEMRVDSDFAGVVRACAQTGDQRRETWINDTIFEGYLSLFEAGFAHSIECWRDGALVGGLYGVSLKGAFFGESMFSRASDASKIALVHLVARLRLGGFTLLDTQFTTPHLESLGAVDITRAAYEKRLRAALTIEADFAALDRLGVWGGAGVLALAVRD
jgi:leucyl/phenylalanyl-tRNA---protein transferase